MRRKRVSSPLLPNRQRIRVFENFENGKSALGGGIAETAPDCLEPQFVGQVVIADGDIGLGVVHDTGICAAKARVVCRGTCAVAGVELVVEAPRVVENSRMCKNLKCLVVGAEFFEAHSQGMVEHAFVVVHAVHRAVAAVERHLAGIHEIAPLAEKVVGRCRQFRYFFIVYCHMVPKISIKIVKIKHIPDGIGSPAVCWLCCRS